MVVIKGSSTQPILMGRNWLEKIRLDWEKIAQSRENQEVCSVNGIEGRNFPITTIGLKDLKTKFADVFQAGIGTVKDIKVDLTLKENSQPIFCKARNVPFALKEKLDKELDRLVENEVIYPVTKTNWASPIVIVPKSDSTVRVCGDFKTTINPCLRTDHYPLPLPEEIFSNISGAKMFCKIDLTAAYNQLCVNETAQELLTINTTRGLFRYRKLPFGITSAGAIFQSVMDKILHGLKNVYCYLDDILLIGQTYSGLYKCVEAVLSRFQQYGVRINAEKSEFFTESITFLGHKLSPDKIEPSDELTEAIKKAPRPTNLTQLRSYLGLINYYGRFLPNLSTLLHPLYNLLNKDVKWDWTNLCENSFVQSKEMLLTNRVLMPFNPDLEIIVTADASPYGIGGLLSHRLADGSERPVAFTSRTLTVHEVKYSQIEKEALALVFVVKKFHTFLYGKHFLLATDHRPLTFLLGPNKCIPTLAAARVQRWALILSAYSYDLTYRKGSDMCHADALSRLPCEHVKPGPEHCVAFFSSDDELPVTHKEISLATVNDPILSKILDFALHGWPSHMDDTLRPYFLRRAEISVERNCVLWGRRVIIPSPFRKEILNLLHQEHPGESRMKSLARSYVWWPKLDQNIEETVKECKICQSTRLPSTLVSDGGPQLTSREFNDFLKSNGILHVVTPPYHPASNGLAERAVQTTKGAFLRQLLQDENQQSKRTLQHRIDSFLFAYRNTPHTATGLTPAELIFNFKPRTRLSLLKPHLATDCEAKQVKIETAANKHRGSERSFQVGQKVFVKSVRQEELNWLPGVVTKIISNVTYLVKTEGRSRFVHADHLRANYCNSEEDIVVLPANEYEKATLRNTPEKLISTPQEELRRSKNNSPIKDTTPVVTQETPQSSPIKTQELGLPNSPKVLPVRRSQRERREPKKLDL
ncbi:uncharacterized protein K02A2.6-like [Macrosteles quadrilineatus]|uniref:uncharacterized protein K02A2.6-like n=1 Tax=Macrosteles quadrilineatus TaxID=74068 RepID=UPI0023E0B268|nr:uncharacterized protein K02A2.6-like [Macrosteles quadrilineatus]